MTRKDFNFLADRFGELLKAGSITVGGFDYFCAMLDNQYSFFNRDAFEKAVVRKVGGKVVTTGGDKRDA